jgi:hypothetical protein
MRGTTLFFGLMTASGITGFLGSSSRVLATDPDPCPKWECRTVHSYWNPYGRSGATTFFEVKTVTESNDGIVDIFTTNSTEKAPTDTKSGERDMWVFPNFTPMCGKSLNEDNIMAWQIHQEVVKSGKGWQPEDSTQSRYPCAEAKDKKGEQSKDQSNPNKAEFAPPSTDF